MYTALVAQQEGEYRYVNSRLLTNAQGAMMDGIARPQASFRGGCWRCSVALSVFGEHRYGGV